MSRFFRPHLDKQQLFAYCMSHVTTIGLTEITKIDVPMRRDYNDLFTNDGVHYTKADINTSNDFITHVRQSVFGENWITDSKIDTEPQDKRFIEFITKFTDMIYRKVFGNDTYTFSLLDKTKQYQFKFTLMCYLCGIKNNEVCNCLVGHTRALDNCNRYYFGMLDIVHHDTYTNYIIDCKVPINPIWARIPSEVNFCINCICGRRADLEYVDVDVKNIHQGGFNFNDTPLYYCYDCSYCWNCINCSNCKYCDGCVECQNCTGCLKCKTHHIKCACQPCEECIDCNACKENCIGLIDCTDCVHCKNCCGCTNCKMCEDCIDCDNCKKCSKCAYTFNEISVKENIEIPSAQEDIEIPSAKVIKFNDPIVVDISDAGDRVEIEGSIIHYYDKDGDILYQGLCQYKNPNPENALNFKLIYGWIYHKEVSGVPNILIATSLANPKALTISDLSEFDNNCNENDTECINSTIEKAAKKTKYTFISIYNRRGEFAYSYVAV